MWKIELNRLLRAKGLYLALLIGMALGVWYFMKYDLPMLQSRGEFPDFSKYGTGVPTAYEMYMGSNAFMTPTYLFLLFNPILAVLPYAMTYHTDRESGWIKNISVRMEKKEYVRIKLTLSFLSGMLVIIIPLVVSFLLTACWFPMKLPQRMLGYTLIGVRNIWNNLFYMHPLIYTLLMILMNGIYGGMMAVLSMLLAHATDKGVLVGIMPFVYHLFLFSFLNLLGHAELSPLRFLNGETSVNYWFQYILVLVLTGLFIVLTYKQGKEKDVY